MSGTRAQTQTDTSGATRATLFDASATGDEMPVAVARWRPTAEPRGAGRRWLRLAKNPGECAHSHLTIAIKHIDQSDAYGLTY
jgi:hypothetical protein